MNVTWCVKAWGCKCEIFKTNCNFLKLKICLSNEQTSNDYSPLAVNDHILTEIRSRLTQEGSGLCFSIHTWQSLGSTLKFAGANQNKLVMKT